MNAENFSQSEDIFANSCGGTFSSSTQGRKTMQFIKCHFSLKKKIFFWKLNLKFKDGVYGFIYDSMYGNITEVKEPITEQTKQLFNNNRVLSLFTDTEIIAEVFGIETETDVTEKWDEILEVVE